MLLLRQQNVYFKENLQFITTSNLFLCLCLSVHYKDMPMVWDEELNLTLRSWTEVLPCDSWGSALHFYGLGTLTDVISTWIYSLLGGKLKWHSKNSQDTELLMSLCSGYWLNLLSILDCEITFFAWWIQSPKQKGDLFSKGCFTVLKDRSSALEKAFLPDLLFCQFNTFSSSSLWQFITQEPVIHGQERGWLPLQKQHPAGDQTGCNVLYSRDLIATCAYTALSVHVILNAGCEETKFVCAITQLASPLSIIQMAPLQCLSLSYIHRGHSSGSHVTTTTRICPGEPQHK